MLPSHRRCRPAVPAAGSASPGCHLLLPPSPPPRSPRRPAEPQAGGPQGLRPSRTPRLLSALTPHFSPFPRAAPKPRTPGPGREGEGGGRRSSSVSRCVAQTPAHRFPPRVCNNFQAEKSQLLSFQNIPISPFVTILTLGGY